MAEISARRRRTPTLNFQGMTVLIADSSPNFATILTSILRDFRFSTIRRTDTGKEALSILKSAPIDITFLDCFLPGVDGFEIIYQMRRTLGPNQMIPMLVLTSQTQETNIVRARDCGANIVIAKPISGTIIFDRLAWAAEHMQDFVVAEHYTGPDRRHRIEGYPTGVGQRQADNIEVGQQIDPTLSQAEIDALFER